MDLLDQSGLNAKAKRRHLSDVDCEELKRSEVGNGSLTHPQTVNHARGRHDPHRGLYPRTPTKRRKPAFASGSPGLPQKSINGYFTVKGVLRSSPSKPALPGSSRTAEFSDDDDISLLNGVEIPDLQPLNDNEIDDMGLLGADEVDHLEGITAEMFADDFDVDETCAAAGKEEGEEEEEEVEALPDSHYGLLGGKPLVEPQGCMDDLPEEILRQVLSLLPAQDLYRNVRRVCHRWKNIVEDSKFAPWKKQYYRYMMREKTTVMDILALMRKKEMNPQSQNSIRNLVALIAEHKVGERVRPADVLECVRGHRLFPQAEASLRLRMPKIPKCTSEGKEGPNPYAAMAVILILSESVDDVQNLVSLLAGCMSQTAIKEYLCHVATMLLAVKRSKIKISERAHYNVYYVLHLMENGPFSVRSADSSKPEIRLTREQQEVLSHDIQKDQVVKIIAFAGTGKTTTLVKYAERRPHLRFLYVAFNKSVAMEAKQRFPSNVDAKTVHSLAFKDMGLRYQRNQKLTSNLSAFNISSALPEGRGGFLNAKVVATTINNFMASADRALCMDHVPEFRLKNDVKTVIKEANREMYLEDAQAIWRKMKDLRAKDKPAYLMPHDGYLKLWQLQNPKPCLSGMYDALFIDEAQDCTPAILDVMLSQSCGKILVGDPHQQIYTFRGAINALQTVGHTHIFYLTQSFRFGAEIAYVGATILKVCKNVEKILVGGKQRGGVCDETADRAAAAVRSGVTPCRGRTAILSRSNLSVFSEAVRLTDANPACRIYFIGSISNMGLGKILDIWQLMKAEDGEPKYIKDPLIRFFAKVKQNPYFALKNYAVQTEDREMEAKLSIVEKYTVRIPELVRRLDTCSEKDVRQADFILGTVHMAKGLEFHTVIVSDDFVSLPNSRPSSLVGVLADEWNLLYVAVTRAQTSLIVSSTICQIITMSGDYFLRSQMPTPLLTVGQKTPPCCISNCPNCLTPGSAFMMSTSKMSRMFELAGGTGPLCERCVWTRIGPTAFLIADDVLSMAPNPDEAQENALFQGAFMPLF